MKKSWVAVLAAAALSLAVVAPVAAASPNIDVSQDKGSSASADGGLCEQDVPEVGDETCEYMNAWAFDGWSRYNGERFKQSSLCVSFGTSIWDVSEETYTDTFTSGCLEGATVSIDRKLASASASGTVPTELFACVYYQATDEYVCDEAVPAADVAVDLAWTGIPPVMKSTNRSIDSDGDCTSRYYSKGSWSEASVSGTLDGAPAMFDWAQLSSGKNRFSFSCHE